MANGCISDATITTLRGVSFDGRVRSRAAGFAVVADPFDGRADAFPAFWRWGGDTGEAAARFLLTGAALAVGLARVAFGGFEAFRGAALGDGSDRDAVERFFAINQWGVTACAENHEFSMPTRGAVIRRAICAVMAVSDTSILKERWISPIARETCVQYNPAVTEAQQPRTEPREIVELRRLKEQQPDLSSAADLQIELLQLQRRVQSRVPLPAINLDAAHLTGLLAAGPILHFDHLKIDWSDVRFLVRAAAAAMRTHEALDAADLRKIDLIARDAERLPSLVRAWFEGTGPSGTVPAELEGLETVLLQAMRPILTRAADAILARVDLADWMRGHCPVCGGEPDLAVITPAAERLLICSRCLARWRFDQIMCPFCRNADRSRITSFTSRDGRYRLSACDVCERYLKAYDARNASRPVMPAVDSVATLPLDAAAMQRGYK